MPLITMPPYSAFTSDQDPLKDNVVLLMHMEGSSLTDSSNRHAFSISGGSASLTTSSKLFGNQSLQINGLAQQPVSTPPSNDFDLGSGDWTIELSIKPTSFPSVAQVMGTWRTFNGSSSARYSWGIFIATGGYCGFSFSISGNYEAANERGTTAVLTANVWNRLAFVRTGNTINMYVNGVLKPFTNRGNTIAAGTTIFNTLSPLVIGGNVDNQLYAGQVDEVRITKGIARYTDSTYDLTTGPFPDPV